VLQVLTEIGSHVSLKTDKEPERYYLLPGQGGRAARRKRTFFWKWSIIAGWGIGDSGVLMYLLNRFVF